MTVDISQDEMNILNLNGISVEDAKANVDYLRATGLSDVEIRNQFSDTIEELRPLTKQSVNDTGNIQVWKAKGPITPFEEGKRKSVKFDSIYSNINENANLSSFDKALKNSKRNQEVKKNILDIEQNKLERNERVNNGTGSFLDRAGALIDRIGESQAKAAINAPDDLTVKMSGINNLSKIDKSQKIGFQEALANSYASGAWIPFAGGWITGSEDKKQRDIIERIRKGEAIRPDELGYINHKIQQKQEENVRGYSLGGNIAKDFLPSLIRFGTELGVGGWVLKGLGLGTKVTESASLGQKALAGLEDMVQTGIVNTALPTGWNNINEIYQNRMLDNTFKLTDKGESIFQQSEEKPSTAFYKSIGQTFIMFASEASGELLKLPIQGAGAAASKYIGSPIAKYLASNKQLVNLYKKSVPTFSKLYEKINKLPIKGENVDWLKSKVRYDGFIEELGEEVVEDVLNLTIGTDNQERSLENYAKAIFKSPDEWAVLAGAIALQGGTLSAASHILGNHMERNGATDDEIVETLNNLSENDKEKAVENLIQNGEINIDSTTEERIENNINNLTESLFDTGKYSSREQAEKVARLGVNMLSSIADKTGIDIEDLINEDMPNIEQDNRDTYVDENGIIHSGVCYNEQEQTLKDRYNDLMNELNNLPDDYSDEEHLNKMITETDLLEKIQSGEKLSIDDTEAVNDLIEKYDANGNKNFANQLLQKLDNTNVDFGNTVVTQRGRNNADNIYHQSAMYRSPIKDFSDFYEQVFEKENHSKKNKSKISKSFYDYSTDNISVRVPHDTVVHDNNKHNLTSTEWKNVLNNLDKPTDAVLSNKPRFDGLPVLLKLVSNKNTYGVVVEFFENKQPIITTAFKDTEKNIDNWLKNGAVQSGTITSFSDISPIQETSWAWNTSTVTTMGMLPSSDSDNIINYVKTKLNPNNPNVNKHEIKQHFQHAITAGATTKDEKLNAIKEWKDKGTNSKYFKKWFGDSKVVDESGKPLVVYHGTNADFDTFDKEKQNKGFFGQGFYFSSDNKFSEHYGKNILPVYLKMLKPYINGNSKDLRNSDFLNKLKADGYDGIIKNFSDGTSTYIVFNPEQIKSVNNQGTFAESNPNIYFQRANRDNLNSNIEENFDDTAENITSYIKDDIQNILDENNVDESEFKLEDIRIYGSYSTSSNKKGSDLDFLVQYSGTMKEDVAFNMFADSNLSITDKNGNDVKVDLNPINSSLSGTIDEHLDYYDNLEPAKKTYFQRATNNNNNVVDLTNDFEKAPSIDEVKAYINEIVENGTKFATLSPNWFVDVKGGRRTTNKILNAGNYKNLEKMGRKRHNKYIMSLEKLLANAEYAGEKENTKKDKKPNVEKYHYFKTDVKIGNKIYQLIFDTEEYKNDNKKSTSVGYAKRNLNETEVDTNIINDKVKNFKDDSENDKSSLSANVLRSVKNLNEDTNSINDNAENINPKTVHLYNIKEIKNPLLYQKQRKMFIDNDRADEISNRLVQVKGSFIPAENLVKLFKDADESTIVHEFAHWWLNKLVKHSEGNEELQEDLKEIRKFVKNNGEEFTDEQHERFARGFEAYMRTGSAKTNRLKKLFEDFKNALLSLYDSIKSLGFEDSEIPEINHLFDRLLTTENQRIQAAVFDRCNTIQSQIEEIRTNQEKELSEIDEIEKNNLERSLQDTRKKQQVEEYLNLADKASSRVPKSVKEYSKRCRQACYEILSAALNHKYSIKYLQMTLAQNNTKAENLRQELSEVDDDITALGGMQSNWYEFFGDTGVNYDTDETDGDAKLVEQALDRIDSNNFTPPESYPGEDIIGKFMGAFDYLSGKVLSLRGANKDAAFEALSELFSGRKFGNLIELNRLPQDVMNEISVRMDEISKTYIEQKTNEKNKYAIPNVSLSTQLRTYVSHKLHETKSYDPIEKKYIRLSSVNKLFSLLPLVNNSLTAKEVVRTINAHAIKQLENRQKYILHKEIQKQVKINSKLIKVGALKQGKFDWKTNTVFAELQQMNRLKKDEARTQYLRLIDADSAVIGEERDNINQNATSDIKAPTDFQGILKVKFLEYKSSDPKNLNLLATRSLLEDILQLKFEGRRAKSEQELKKALTRYDYKNNLIEIMDKHRNNKVAKYLARWTAGDTIWTSEGTLANWESLLTGIFDKATAEKYSLLKAESDVEVYAHRKALGFYKKAMDIYHLNRSNEGLKNKFLNVWDRALDFDNIQPLVDLFRKYDETNYPFKQVTWNKDTGEFVETTIELSHSQLITLYAWSLNPNLKERLITQFVGEDVPKGAEKLDELMFSKLSEEDKLFAWAMVDTCDTMYEDTNEVFIRTTGLSLPKVDNYIPSKTERIGSDLDMMHETMLRSTNPSFIKQRKNCSRIKMDPISPLEIILPHINKTARYVVMSEKVKFYNRIFQSPDIKAKMVEIYGKKSGEKIHRILLNQLATSTYDNYAKSITVGKNLIDNIASNYITSKIGGNLKVMFSQLTSMVNYCENMPFGMWSKGFSEALAHPKKTVDFMFKNCEYLQARLAGNSQNEIISMLTNESDKFRALRNFCTSNTKYGDIIAIMFGGKPYVDYLMSQGMSQEEAFTKFTEDTLRSQQSGHSSATSAWQKQVAQHAITRMFFAFNNTNFQYERKIVDAMANLTKGDISKEEFMKSFLIYKVFNPILFTSFLSDLSLLILFQNMFGGGDDDPLFAFGSDIINAIFLSNWKAYGVLGTLANSIVSLISAKATGGTYFEDKLPLISDFETSINKLLKGKNLELADYIEMLAGAGDYSTGIAASRLYNAAGGIGDMMQGELGTGLLRFVGYGRYRANMAATGEPPERKKK